MLALPFVFVIFIINFEAGLIVYWITTNIWTIGQQFAVRKLFPKPEPIEPKVDAGSKPARGKPPAKARGDGAAKARRQARRRRRARRQTETAARRRARRRGRARRRSGPAGGASGGRWRPARGGRGRDGRRGEARRVQGARAGLPRPEPGRRRVRGARRARRGRRASPARVAATVDLDAWEEGHDELPEEPAERVRAVVVARRAGARARGDGGHRGDAPTRSARR